MLRVLGNTSCDLDPQGQGQMSQGQIMYFLANESSPEPLDITTSKFTGA